MKWWTAAPVIVAESLVGVPDALVTALQPGGPASAASVAARLASSLAPPEHAADPPSWLLPEQVRSFRRVLAALTQYRGALLADAVGSGKTYVALAAAAALNRGPTVCLVPATLLEQWQVAADRVGVPVNLSSHEQTSRGKLPPSSKGLVIVDESHHFRNPHTKRYRHLARWLVGRAALLVTATPIVNRPADLIHQLLLTVRDNALAAQGIASLKGLIPSGCQTPALGNLVLESEVVTDQRPRRAQRSSPPSQLECRAISEWIALVGRLCLSRSSAIASLIRGVLLRAAVSSPAALSGALRRYRRLLLHACDAERAGRPMDRAMLRKLTGELGDQLIWWELLPATPSVSELELKDLSKLDGIIAQVSAACQQEDQKLERLRHLLGDGKPSLVFTTSRDTVRYARDRLQDIRLAWCTGEHAGIGCTHLPRRSVLGWFREPDPTGMAPHHLIVTDVAAEGLDLQRAARVIHYDLPWTPMRLEQREGRSVRYGSLYSEVDVIRFATAPAAERLLRMEATLRRKETLPASTGLGPAGRHLWRWRAELAERFRAENQNDGVAVVDSSFNGLLAGFTLTQSARPHPVSASVLWLEPDGCWTEAPDVIADRLAAAAAEQRIIRVEDEVVKEWLSRVADPIRERLAFARSRRWISPDPTGPARRLLQRLHILVRQAVRGQRVVQLKQLEQAISFVAGGHTAGEAAWVERLANAPDHELTALASQLPVIDRSDDGLAVRLTGLVVFGPAKGGRVALACQPCPDCKPSSSTSTGP